MNEIFFFTFPSACDTLLRQFAHTSIDIIVIIIIIIIRSTNDSTNDDDYYYYYSLLFIIKIALDTLLRRKNTEKRDALFK